MDTGQLKRFACQARVMLKQGVKNRLEALGFVEGAPLPEQPIRVQGATVYRGNVIEDEGFYDRWMALNDRIRLKGIPEVYEEAAYTWFNRLVALSILTRNDLCEPVLNYEDDVTRVPNIVTAARRGRFPVMTESQRRSLMRLLDDDSKTFEQFNVLITAFCHNNPIIRACFGGITEYTEMLLPANVLAQGGFLDLLNHTDYITDDDFRSPELIGWLYQFYISERKDEVFAKKGKYTPDEIPAATQIFTPNWIVKYMVQNTVGRIYLDNHPEATEHFKPRWKYLVDPAQPSPGEATYKFKELPELSLADLACGSGHILTECFDLLFDLYDYEDYSTREAVENIFTHNLTGIDIDTRAKQLATFALMLKACQRDRAFADAHVMPQVLDMPDVDCYTWKDLGAHMMCALKAQLPSDKVNQELVEAFKLMEQAHNLGSIMKFDVSPETRDFIKECLHQQSIQHQFEENFANLFHGFEIILALTERYSVLVMNPPYMKATNMNDYLKGYVEKYYESSCFDMYSTFMNVAMNGIDKNGMLSMIVQPTWLVNSSFGELRQDILDNFHIDSLLHMGRGNFGNDWGSISFTLSKKNSKGLSHFFKLYERTFYRIEPEHISELFLTSKNNSDFRYNFSSYSSNSFKCEHQNDAKKIHFVCSQDRFKGIVNCPFCYSFSDEIIDTINKNCISQEFIPATGLQTGNNAKYIRAWFETSLRDRNIKWFPLVNGGDYRKWYGNFNDFIYWYNDGQEIKNCKSSVLRNQQFYKKPGITWNRIASRGITLRAFPQGCFFDQAGDSMFCSDIEKLQVCMGYLNTKVAKTFFDMLAPTINLTAGMIGKLPYKPIKDYSEILNRTNQNISISREDWDAHETSWDFKENELLRTFREETELSGDQKALHHIDVLLEYYKNHWEECFERLHANEEELNRQFIDIYGLQDELTPDVPMNEVTILQQGEISIENNEIVWHDDVIMKQFISYAVGCMMGRYSIDKPGLILANQGDGLKEYEAQVPNSRFEVDDDGIIPLLPADCGFPDNARARIIDFLKTVFGNETLSLNLNFVEQCLGKTLEQYLIKDFWKDHKSRYQNRPIYWLFRSKRGAFQCVVYMHRMTQWTADQVRHKYLLPYIDNLRNRLQQALDDRKQSTADKLRKAIDECEEYQERLKVVADRQIAFDLDDGVAKNYVLFGDVLAKI